MGLAWVRLDSNVGTHDKILSLIADPNPKRWQALSSYFIALGWSGGHGTDGLIPRSSLLFVHGTPQTARLLVTYDLWSEVGVTGWQINNYAERQQLSMVSEAKKAAQSLGGRKARCRQNHGPACGCWEGTK